MYKLLLCWRYLRTRYLAMVCIVSVMLGVATLIVVNSVMGGFSSKLKQRLHGLLSDIVIESSDLNGFADPQGKMEIIRQDPLIGDRVEAMAATMEIFAMLQFEVNGHPYTRAVRLIGIDPESRAKLGGFQEFLINPRHRQEPARAFDLDEEAQRRFRHNQLFEFASRPPPPEVVDEEVPPLPPGLTIPQAGPSKPPPEPPPRAMHITHGVILGYSIAHYRAPNEKTGIVEELRTLQPGDEVCLTTVSGAMLKPVYERFAISDYIKTEMSEYDGNYVYVPLDHLQRLRAMDDRVSAVQIKLKDYNDAKFVKDRLNALFGSQGLLVNTWEDKQGPLLAAINIEKGILNVLLFLIIAVAGFGILAIFSMIVVEKTRDIGVLKALGASRGGILRIFLGYGLLLGVVGAGMGTGLGLWFTANINEIEKFLSGITGQEVFNRTIYYFDRIPVDVQAVAVILVNLGAIAIAVLFSVLPALRAAMLHPVRALRYE